MNIVMLTNTYLPHVGGVAQSVARFARQLRMLGHRVLVVAPTFDDFDDRDDDVLRVPAIQNFNGSDFSVRLPVPWLRQQIADTIEPDVVHTHHPFLLGDTALHLATGQKLPLVFTHHTMYEQYTHYVPGDSDAMKRFVIRMATEYANLCDRVIAPSESIADVLRGRGVTTPIEAIPTGVDPEKFTRGDGGGARQKHGLPADAFVVGHLGRLAPEKNLPFLAKAVGRFVAERDDAHFLLVGDGPSMADVVDTFERLGVRDRLHATGSLSGQALTDAYHAMDVFAFASLTETQGMVLAEAMAAGLPVAAIDAPGVREIVEDGCNGRLVHEDAAAPLGEAIGELVALNEGLMQSMRSAARSTAQRFDTDRCAAMALGLYEQVLAEGRDLRRGRPDPWEKLQARIETEWNLWSTRVGAAIDTLGESPAGRSN